MIHDCQGYHQWYEDLISALRDCVSLKCVKIKYMELQGEESGEIFQTLRLHQPQLEVFEYPAIASPGGFLGTGVEELANLLRDSNQLHTLDISRNGVVGDVLQEDSLPYLGKLKCLDLSYNMLSVNDFKRVVDEDSIDRWAREVGWYVTTLDEEVEEPFTHLSDALRAHDMHVVFMKREERVENRDLNFPREYSDLLQYEIDNHFSSRIGLMLANDRLSDPIMRRIGRILITFIHPSRIWELEDPDRTWKLVTGHIQDGEWITNREIADYVYKLALAKQCFDPDSVSMCTYSNCSISLIANMNYLIYLGHREL